MKPILKWTGGKRTELATINQYKPDNIDRYIEPFLGGGALFFGLEHKENIVNDFNRELVSFYQLLKTNSYIDFKTIISKACYQRTTSLNKEITDTSFKSLFNLYRDVSDDEIFPSLLTKELKSKKKSIEKINGKNREEGKPALTFQEEVKFYQTACLASLYYLHRDRYNTLLLSNTYNTEHIAMWFIMRELSYSGMFRYSKQGKFNVPYGGASYNNKKLTDKLKYIEEVNNQSFFNNSIFCNQDFESFFNDFNNFNENDFIFLDPPYDSEFSQYNREEDFTKDDQVRLRDLLLKTKANIMVVIKETEFIKNIYQEAGFYISDFNKNYSVNFKNRNDKGVNHLIITNYKTI